MTYFWLGWKFLKTAHSVAHEFVKHWMFPVVDKFPLLTLIVLLILVVT